MGKKKKSSTEQMKEANQVILGGALTLQNMELLRPGALTPGSGAYYNAGYGTGAIAVNATLSDVAFKAIDNISKSGTKKKKK